MCGICGIYRAEGIGKGGGVEAMCRSLVHRGPDSQGIYTGERVALGIRRLRIIDLFRGDQPIFNEDRSLVVVFNGEIYNYRELRQSLQAKGHRFYTDSDTEVLVHLYEECGEEGVSQLNGIFAFALWDEKNQSLFLARDHLGVKPLYYAHTPRGLVFASEMKALLTQEEISRRLDLYALDDFLTYRYVPAPRSILQGISKLLPGHWLRCRGGEVTVKRYWDVDFPGSEESLGEEEWVEQVRHLFSQAVTMQMVSDVPLGAFLSGGLDSSAVVALMSQVSPQPVKTYSVRFRGLDGYDEGDYARQVADYLGTDHHEVEVEARATELLPRLAEFLDEPMADAAALPTYLMCQVARQEVTVALTGEGADELFAGYGWYAWADPSPLARLAQGLPSWLRQGLLRGVEGAFRGRRGKRTLMAPLLPTFEERYFETVACSVFQRHERESLYSPEAREGLRLKSWQDDFGYYLAHSQGYSPQSRMQYLDTKIWLADDPLTKVDRMSMAVSLEARVPFLDYRLVELSARIPSRYKLRNGVSKYILRQSVAHLLPSAILERPKHAFDVPVGQWLRGELRPMLRELPRHPALKDSGLFNVKHVQRLVDEHLRGRLSHGPQLWSLLNFALWHSRWLKGNDRT